MKQLSDAEFEPLAKRLYLPGYYGEGEEDVRKIVFSHIAQSAELKRLRRENTAQRIKEMEEQTHV